MKSVLFCLLLGASGVLLIAFGSSSQIGQLCRQQPQLPVWMTIAGGFLLIFTLALLSALYLLPKKKKSVRRLGWAFCCGIFVLLFCLLLWLALWVAGSYLIISVMQDRLVPKTNRAGELDASCADATLGVAAFVLLLIWLLFTGLVVQQILQVCCGRPRQQRSQEEYHHQETVLLA